MSGRTVRIKDDFKRVLAAARDGSFRSLGHAGAAIRLAARRSIKKSKSASPEGRPPHSRKGQLRGAIVYAVEAERQLVVIGPEAAQVGTSGRAHEFGGRYKRQRYPKRPFMGPALEKLKERLPKLWAGSVQ
ncbi:MAG TPA: hypothetical protein VGE52_19955 [Pirellulales bacterium]